MGDSKAFLHRVWKFAREILVAPRPPRAIEWNRHDPPLPQRIPVLRRQNAEYELKTSRRAISSKNVC